MTDLRIDPPTLEALTARIARNRYVASGAGGGATMHQPCVFCGAPDFLAHDACSPDGMRAAWAVGATCRACGRSGRVVFHHPAGGPPVGTFVQTGGPDAPAYLQFQRAQ